MLIKNEMYFLKNVRYFLHFKVDIFNLNFLHMAEISNWPLEDKFKFKNESCIVILLNHKKIYHNDNKHYYFMYKLYSILHSISFVILSSLDEENNFKTLG